MFSFNYEDVAVGRVKYFIAVLFILSVFIGEKVFASDKLMVEYPSVNAGEAEIGMRMISLYDNKPDVNNAQTRKVGGGYGITPVWSSELYAEYEKAADNTSLTVQSYEWENMFRLGAPGLHWADWAMILEYTYSVDRSVQDAVSLMPIMQKRLKNGIVTLNFGFERNPGENGTNHWQFSYAWQYLWRGNRVYQFAVEGFGQMGDFNHWSPASEQTQQAGPALIGKIRSDGDSDLGYRLGLFFGLTRATPNRALMASMEYEF